MKSNEKRVWVLTDERPGNQTQSIGVAQQLPFAFEEKRLHFSSLGQLPNRMLGQSRFRLDTPSRALIAPPWPDIAIAAGRKLAPILRYIKRKNPHCFTTYLMNPQVNTAHFDLVAIPQHDLPKQAQNIMPTLGMAHRVTPELLKQAGEKWRPKLRHLPTPRIAVLVGGNSRSAEFYKTDFHEIGALASELALKSEASLLVTTSPRTPPRGYDYLRLALSVDHELFHWYPEAENPYLGYLALSKAVIVTGDSMSMCAEACSMGKPVFIYTPRQGQVAPKLKALHEALYQAKLAQPLTAGVSLNWKPSGSLNEAERIAREMIRRQ